MDGHIQQLNALVGLINSSDLRHQHSDLAAFHSLISRSGRWTRNDQEFAARLGLEWEHRGLKSGSYHNQVKIESMTRKAAALVAVFRSMAPPEYLALVPA